MSAQVDPPAEGTGEEGGLRKDRDREREERSLAKTPPLQQARKWDLARTTSSPVLGTTTASSISGSLGSAPPAPSSAPTTGSGGGSKRYASGMSGVGGGGGEDDVSAVSGGDDASAGPSTSPSSPACSPGEVAFASLTSSPAPSAPPTPITSPPPERERASHIRLSTTPLFPSPLAQALIGGEADADDEEGGEVETLELTPSGEQEDDDVETGPAFEGLEGDDTVMPEDTTPTAATRGDKGKRSSREVGAPPPPGSGLRIVPGSMAAVGAKEKMRVGSPLRRVASIGDPPLGEGPSSRSTSSSPSSAPQDSLIAPPAFALPAPAAHPPASAPTHSHRRRSLYAPQTQPKPPSSTTTTQQGYTGGGEVLSTSPLMPSTAMLASPEPAAALSTSIPRQTSPLGFRKPEPRLSVGSRGSAGPLPIPIGSAAGAVTSPSISSNSGNHSRHTSLSSTSASGTSRRNSLIFGSSPTRTSNRSALSAALASNASMAPPAPPAPGEAIKIQRVPTSVRLAQDLRPAGSQPSSPISAFSTRPLPFEAPPPPVPPTPMATRAGSPVDSSSESSRGGPHPHHHAQGGWSSGLSTGWTDAGGGGAASSTPGTSLASPIVFSSSVPATSGAVGAPGSVSSAPGLDSAFAPVFPFASKGGLERGGSKSLGRDRSRSVFSASSEASGDGSTSMWGSAGRFGSVGGGVGGGGGREDVGSSSPATQPSSLSPPNSALARGTSARAVSLGSNAFGGKEGGGTGFDRRLSTSVNERRALNAHRTSVNPADTGGGGALGGIGGGAGGPTTEEFAKIIMQSRSAKINKWRSARPGSSEGVVPGSMSGVTSPPTLSGMGAGKHSTGSLGAAEGLRVRTTSGVGHAAERRKGIPDFGSLGALPSTPMEEDAAMLGEGSASGGEGAAGVRSGGEAALSSSALGIGAIGGEKMGTGGMAGLMGGPAAEIEWVDWLDDYHKLKARKLKHEEDEKRRSRAAASSAAASQVDLGQHPEEERAEGKEGQEDVMKVEPVAEQMQIPAAPSELSVATQETERESEALPPVPLQTYHTTSSITDSHGYFPSADGNRQRRLSVSSLLGRGRPEAGRAAGALPLEPVPSDPLHRAGVSPVGKRKKNFNLGRKIDEWWTAVRSSFAGDEPKTPGASTSVRTPGGLWKGGERTRERQTSHHALNAPPPPAAAAVRPPPPSLQQPSTVAAPMPLRNAASSIDLQRFSARSPPSGALAPAARIAAGQSAAARLGPPPAPARTTTSNSGSSQGSEEQASSRAESGTKRRNPNLTLKLDTMTPADFSDVFRGFSGSSSDPQRQEQQQQQQSEPPTEKPPPEETASTVKEALNLPERPKPKATGSDPMQRLGIAPRSEVTPSGTPGPAGVRLWDQTPGLVFGDPFRPNAPPANTQQRPPPGPAQDDSSPQDAAFSLHTIHQHIRFRLATAKASCDRELKGIVKEITSYVEAEGYNVRENERLAHEAPESVGESPDVGKDSEAADTEGEAESEGLLSPPRKQSALPRRPLSRTLSVPGEAMRRGQAANSDSDPGSTSGSAPVSRKSSGHGRGRDVSGGTRRTSGAPRRAHLVTHRADSPLVARSVSGSSHQGESAASSRSTSRSRSPLPPRPTTKDSPVLGPQTQPHSSEVSTLAPEEEGFYSSAFIHSLQELSSIATEVIDTPIGTLTAKPHACSGVIHRIQRLGKLWDAHPEWPSRGWYVRTLLSVAGLSRVLEWWDAEKGFWDFAPEDDDDSEEIHFVANRDDDDAPEQDLGTTPFDGFALPPPQHVAQAAPQAAPAEMPTSPLDTSHSFPMPSPRPSSTLSPKPADQHLDQSFKTAIELARTETILAEVSLAEAQILYLNAAWTQVTGLDPHEVIGIPIGDLIDKNPDLFNQANQKLLEDVGNTVELQFTIKISLCHSETEEGEPATEDHFIPMTGKGMLMVDRVTGEPTHSMWILRLAPRTSEQASPISDIEGRAASAHVRSLSDPVAPVFTPVPLSTEPLLCRICEHHVPAYYFERHNETCAETHRLESQISECNERLTELRDVARNLRASLDRPAAAQNLEYGGTPLLILSYVPSPLSPLNPSRPTQSLTPQHLALRASQTAALDLVEELVAIALEVSTPSSSDDAENTGIENLRLLSPTSENKLAAIAKWRFTSIEDPAISTMAEDCLGAARLKAGIVNRMRNTILYAERIRIEWEAKAQQVVAESNKRMMPASPMPKAALAEETGRPRSAPIPDDQTEVESVTRPASVQGLRPTDHIEPSLHPPVKTPELSTVTADLKGLGFFNASHPANSQSPFQSPMRSPRLVPSNVTSRRGSENQEGETPASSAMPLSPRIPSAVPAKAKSAASIKDFDMIKPISKGAFGQVWLAKKKTTGQYYAIKILKKQDMIAKNQILNVKSERKILMNQSDSDFVVKLYYTFSSRDHLYLVMEYLNGGDCASLIKTLGELPEDWARNYIAEVVLGLEYLHSTDVIHRDLKPDNLLIDSHGHLKLTDFGLSKIGLLGRQATGGHSTSKHMSLPGSMAASFRERSQDRRKLRGPPFPPVSGTGSRSASPDSAAGSGLMSLQSSYFMPHTRSESGNQDTPSESSSRTSEPYQQPKQGMPFASFGTAFGSQSGARASGFRSSGIGIEGAKPFFGTPDYLAPETILGFEMGETVDWWALGVICYEFLHGFPPFNDETPDKVFENIVQHRLHFPDPDISPEARDFIEKLLNPDPTRRLGYNGAEEVKSHPFLAPTDWPNLFKEEPSFVPRLDDPEATDYFDPRGATELVFRDEEETEQPPGPKSQLRVDTNALPGTRRMARERSETEPAPPITDDFGTFNYKNLPVLERENEEVIRKLKGDQAHERPTRHARHMSFAGQLKQPFGPASPADSASSSSHSVAPRRPGLLHTSTGPLTQTSSAPVIPGHSPTHSRRPSEYLSPLGPTPVPDDAIARPSSVPSRVRSASFSGSVSSPPPVDISLPALPVRGGVPLGDPSEGALSSTASSPRRSFKKLPPAMPPPQPSTSAVAAASKAALALHGSPKAVPPPGERTVDCLIAEDNPISSKILETILVRLGCRCVVVSNGEEAISCAMGDIQFDVMFFDLLMPIIEGQDAARMIKSTQNPNMRTPIIAVTSFESYISEQGTLFAAVLAKPVQKSDLLTIFKKLGFVAKHKPTRGRSGDGGIVAGKPRKESVELLKSEPLSLPGEGGPKNGALAGEHLLNRPRASTGASASTDSSSGGLHSRHDSMNAPPPPASLLSPMVVPAAPSSPLSAPELS